jgi:hypothetical protein
MNGQDSGGQQARAAKSGSPGSARPRIAAALGPIVMAVLFFAVLTPIGVVLQTSGRDPLRLRPQRDAASYWLPIAARGRLR